MANKKFYYRNKNRSAKDDALATQRKEALAGYTKEQLDLTLEALGLGEPVRALLSSNKIAIASDLVTRTQKDMYKVQGFNKHMLTEVEQSLARNGMALMDDVSDKRRPAQDKQPLKDKAVNDKVRNADDDSAAKGADKGKTTSVGETKARTVRFGLADKSANRQTDAQTKQDRQIAKATARQERQNAKKAGKQVAIPMAPDKPKITQPLPVEHWRKVLKGGKWGFSDGIRTVIAPSYDEVFCFKEGLASVELDGRCGYIDSENNIVIPFEYDTAMSFSEGLAMVVKGEKCGYINKQNEVVFPFEYDAATAFENGEAKVKKAGKWATLKKDGSFSYI